MKTLNIIGAGRLGRVIGSLLCQTQLVELLSVLNRSLDSAQEGVNFIGHGDAVGSMVAMMSADITLIAVPDDEIVKTAQALGDSGVVRPGDVVFHCSGLLSSDELSAVSSSGGHVASIHPLQTFVGKKLTQVQFSGTYCVSEGDHKALTVLEPILSKMGANVVGLEKDKKVLYHAASVMGCNYMVVLLDMCLGMMERAGIAREVASKMVQPLLNKTLDNVFSLDTVQALTGPIARGDTQTVARHLKDIERLVPEVDDAYRVLGDRAVKLSDVQGNASKDSLGAISNLLKNA